MLVISAKGRFGRWVPGCAFVWCAVGASVLKGERGDVFRVAPDTRTWPYAAFFYFRRRVTVRTPGLFDPSTLGTSNPSVYVQAEDTFPYI